MSRTGGCALVTTGFFPNCVSVFSRKVEASLPGPCPGGPTCLSSDQWGAFLGLTPGSKPGGVSSFPNPKRSCFFDPAFPVGRGVRENSRLASMERASPDACLAGNSLIPACGPYSVNLSDSPDLGAGLFQVLGVKGLQRQSSCANWSFNEGCPKSCFPHRGLHGGIFTFLLVRWCPFLPALIVSTCLLQYLCI